MTSPIELRQQAPLLSLVAAVIGGACGDTPAPAAVCETSTDCASGYACINQRCEPVVGQLDAGPSSQDAETLDAGNSNAEDPDAGNPDAEDPDAENPDDGNPNTGNSDVEDPDTENPDAETGDGAGSDAVCGAAACQRWSGSCGHMYDDCGGEVDCGQCSYGYTCENYHCVPRCTPRSCGPYECGHVDLGCGVTEDCGWCREGQSCRDNRCVDTCNCAPIEYCSGGECVCRPLHRGIRIGDLEHGGSSADWDEFGNYSDPHPTYYVGDPVWNVRPWIGHSECPTCTPGTTKKQRLIFSGLVPGVTYILAVYPSWVSGSSYYRAQVVRGSATIVGGSGWNYTGPIGHVHPEAPWFVQFVAHSTEVGLDVGNDRTWGSEYLYVDRYDFAPQHPCR